MSSENSIQDERDGKGIPGSTANMSKSTNMKPRDVCRKLEAVGR